jgi:hypothetical protein
MSHSDDHPFPHATWLDIPLGIRAYLIMLLNSTLACTIISRGAEKRLGLSGSWKRTSTTEGARAAL